MDPMAAHSRCPSSWHAEPIAQPTTNQRDSRIQNKPLTLATRSQITKTATHRTKKKSAIFGVSRPLPLVIEPPRFGSRQATAYQKCPSFDGIRFPSRSGYEISQGGEARGHQTEQIENRLEFDPVAPCLQRVMS